MTTHYILLELGNLNHIRNLKTVVFNNFGAVNRELCIDYGLNWLCETNPHITLLGEVMNVSNNETYRQLKYSDDKVFKRFKKKCEEEGLTFPELIIDTFDNDNARVLKINCSNCNLYNELSEVHELLKSKLENEEKFDKYEPHITLTYLRPDASDNEVNKIKTELLAVLPKNFTADSIALSDSTRTIDRISLKTTLPQFGGF